MYALHGFNSGDGSAFDRREKLLLLVRSAAARLAVHWQIRHVRIKPVLNAKGELSSLGNKRWVIDPRAWRCQ